MGKVAFGLVKDAKKADLPKEICKTWNRLVSKYAPHTASSLLKLKSEFHSCKLELIENNWDEQILTLEWLRMKMNEFCQ